jgi:hypothetical protein
VQQFGERHRRVAGSVGAPAGALAAPMLARTRTS